MATIKLRNVRLSFPSLFKKAVIDGVQSNKYEATFLFPKSDTETYDMLMEHVDAIKAENKKSKLDNDDFDNFFIKDGDAIYRKKGHDGYQGMWAVKAGNTKRPPVFDKDGSILTEDDEKIYPGCYVHGNIDLWFQNNNYGLGINANLHGVMFAKDGEEFGDGARVATVDDFDDVEPDEEF